MREILLQEYHKALEQYDTALNQENNCQAEYIDSAIEKVNVAQENLKHAIKQLKQYDSETSPVILSHQPLNHSTAFKVPAYWATRITTL